MTEIIKLVVKERLDRVLMRPFWRLVAHFGQRLFAGSNDAGEGELNLGVGTVLALLALPGMFITVILFDKYSSLIRYLNGDRPFDPIAQSLPDQYFFFVFSMVVTGVVTALKWDSIFPGRQDYVNLAPLPVPTRNIFLANIIAIVTVTVLFAVDVNAVSAIVFPYMVNMEKGSFREYVLFTGVHGLGVLLCSLFIFFALFAVIGTLMAVLPNHLFRKLSLYIRVGVVIAMLTLLATSFAVPEMLRDFMRSHSSLLWWLPPVWFLGLARSLIGKATPQLAQLGVFGLRMILGSIVAATAAYVISYYRYFIRIPENLDVTIQRREPRRWLPEWVLDSVVLRSPFERACYRFTLKTLLRNERQSLILGGFVGLGLVLASEALNGAFVQKTAHADGLPNAAFLSLPLILAFFVISGLRFVFELPAELRANWAARVIVDEQKHQAVPVARKVMLSLVWPWLLLIALPVYIWYLGWAAALAHITVVMVWSYCLASFLLHGYRKIAFTCAYAPWKQNATVVVILYALGAFVFVSGTAAIEHGLLRHGPVYLWMMALGGFAAWKLFVRLRTDELDPTGLIFEDASPPAVELLNLTRN